MHTELKIKSLENRAFILYYFNGVRQREYNGNKLSLSIYPNKAKTKTDKIRLLNKLKFELEKALEKGWNPLIFENSVTETELTLESSIKKTLAAKLSENYSRTYKRDLERTANKFLEFITRSERKGVISKFDSSRLLEFLNCFMSSNRNYMNMRQNLNVLLPGTIQKTPRKKTTEQLHEIYNKDSMLKILKFLEEHYSKLHLVALLAYGCLLRPHEESRLLQKKHIKNDKIYLSGEENKGKKVRVVHIPEYVLKELNVYLNACPDSDAYLFTGSTWALNPDYFKTQWSRAKRQLLEMKLIEHNQTLYSFRHTAAVDVYRRTKDVYLLQKLLGHSNIVVTLKYLRGLGEYNQEELKDAAPRLDF